jgi:hypothetical protein
VNTRLGEFPPDAPAPPILPPAFDEGFYVLAGFEQYFADGAAQARPPDESTIVVGGRLDEAQGSARRARHIPGF